MAGDQLRSAPLPVPASAGTRPAARSSERAAELVEMARGLLAEASALLAGTVARDDDAVALLATVESAESVRAVATAAQMRAEVAFRAARIRAQKDAGAPRTEIGRGITEEIAIARRMSPARCANQSALRRVVVDSLPRALDLLEQGRVTEWAVEEVAKAVITLDDEDRAQVDADLAPRLPEVSPRTAGALARARAAELDQDAALARMRREESERHVSIRPVSDAVVQLSAILPMAAGIAAFAALDRAAKAARAAGEPGTRGQHMADALFSRLTGKGSPADCDVEIQLLMTDRTLLGEGSEVAWLDGHPVPAEIARRFALSPDRAPSPDPSPDADPDPAPDSDPDSARGSGEAEREAGRRFIRRLYTDPVTGRLRDADARRRAFTGHDRRLVEMAYQRCAMPWCEARIQQIHHVQRFAEGGATTADNGAATCEHCNYLLERDGWASRILDPAPDGQAVPVMEVTTPTGRRLRCAPPPLRRPPPLRPAAAVDTTVPPGAPPVARGSHLTREHPPPPEPEWDRIPLPAWEDVPERTEVDITEDPLGDADWERLVAALTLTLA